MKRTFHILSRKTLKDLRKKTFGHQWIWLSHPKTYTIFHMLEKIPVFKKCESPCRKVFDSQIRAIFSWSSIFKRERENRRNRRVRRKKFSYRKKVFFLRRQRGSRMWRPRSLAASMASNRLRRPQVSARLPFQARVDILIYWTKKSGKNGIRNSGRK